MSFLRSLLFVPGNIPRMLDRAVQLKPDAFILDLEDSVPIDEKDTARTVTTSYVEQFAGTGHPVIPRVNSLDSGFLEHDLQAVVGTRIFGVSVGKIDNPMQILEICKLLQLLEIKSGIMIGVTKLIPWIESASAIIHAHDICRSSSRIIGVALGAEDFTNDMGIGRHDDDRELVYARNVIATAASASGVQAFDTPYFAFRDAEGLRENSLVSKSNGFGGRFAIHPSQLEIINKAYSPSLDEIQHAKDVIVAFNEAKAQGRGSTSLDGKVVDVPVVKRAVALLDRAKSIRVTP